MPWAYDSDYDSCPHCEEYGQDCGEHGDVFEDAADVLKSLSGQYPSSEAEFDDTPWITTRKPKADFL